MDKNYINFTSDSLIKFAVGYYGGHTEDLVAKGKSFYYYGRVMESLDKVEDAMTFYLTYIIHSGFISGYQNRYGDNLKPPTNVYHRMTA